MLKSKTTMHPQINKNGTRSHYDTDARCVLRNTTINLQYITQERVSEYKI